MLNELNVRLGQKLHQRAARATAESGMSSLNRWIQQAPIRWWTR